MVLIPEINHYKLKRVPVALMKSVFQQELKRHSMQTLNDKNGCKN